MAAPSVIDRGDPQPDHGERQQRVQRQAAAVRAAGTAGASSAAGLIGLVSGGHRDQSVFEVPATNFSGLPNHCEAIRRAIGAAVSAPKPPCSTVTAITIGRLGSPT